MRRYLGWMADSRRWDQLALRPDDIVISTPSKCGTTWMQNLVGMLVFGRVDLGAPLSALSPWLDMQLHPIDEVLARLEAQPHRRFIKTHTPLDGLPEHPSVSYLTVVRHPLDVALSDRDHSSNTQVEVTQAMRARAVGDKDLDVLPARPDPPEDATEYLRWWVDSDLPPTGSGPNSLADMCEQAAIAWARRHRPNVHLFHYGDLVADTEAEMRHLAGALDIPVDPAVWPDLVEASSFASMRERAEELAPEAAAGIWRSPQDFFRQSGTRDWRSLLDDADVAHFERRLDELAGDAADWIRHGRTAVGQR